MAVGLWDVAELGQARDDRDGRVGHTGEVARQVANIDVAAVFTVDEVTHLVQAVLDLLVVAQQRRGLLRGGLRGLQRGRRIAHFGAGLAGVDLVPLAFGADGLLAAVQGGLAVPFQSADVLDPVAEALDAVVLLGQRLEQPAGAEFHLL